ncbi:hypothetical protein [Methylocystis parvus]|jgi:hypothetical protein|uniref:hypothetical protein n=1 Tax=Methylocystis parvus TaxID=134 RepID=UPI003C716780
MANIRYSPEQLAAGVRALKSEAVISGAATPKAAFCEAMGVDERTAVLPDFIQEACRAAEKPNRERRAYAAAVAGLPEAAERPKAAARIAQIHDAKSLPLHRASALLASLPSEAAEAREAEIKAAEQRRAQAESQGPQSLKRRVEIRVAALSLRADKGDEGARSEQRKLQYAMSIVAQSPSTPLSTALTLAGANVAAIR